MLYLPSTTKNPLIKSQHVILNLAYGGRHYVSCIESMTCNGCLLQPKLLVLVNVIYGRDSQSVVRAPPGVRELPPGGAREEKCNGGLFL